MTRGTGPGPGGGRTPSLRPVQAHRRGEAPVGSAKSVRQALADCVDCARYGARSWWRRAWIFLRATRGMVGQVTSSAVVCDAETAEGGSGGPVLSSRGEVVAVSRAIMREFGGSNLGVPVTFARRLLESAAGSGDIRGDPDTPPREAR